MQPELITALAALGGAAVGGLTTVWATHRTNRAAADRERAQRLHDQRLTTYNQALEAVSVFAAARLNTTALYAMNSPKKADEGLRMREAAIRVQVLLPALEDAVTIYLLAVGSKDDEAQNQARIDFLRAARAELDKLRPE